MTAAAIAKLLEGYKFTALDEAELQTAVAQALTAGGVPFEREVSLAKGDRIDFLCAGGVGLELKTQGAPTSVLRQLQRYAGSDRVSELVLVTTRLQHQAVLAGQSSVLGKPFRLSRVRSGLF